MKIAVDVDGTITEFKERYKKLICDLIKTDNEIWIMTGREPKTYSADIKMLTNLGVLQSPERFLNSGLFNEQEKQVGAVRRVTLAGRLFTCSVPEQYCGKCWQRQLY